MIPKSIEVDFIIEIDQTNPRLKETNEAEIRGFLNSVFSFIIQTNETMDKFIIKEIRIN